MTKFDLRGEDCIKGMSRLTNESVDLVVTSPPYNLGLDYRQYADRQNRRSYLNWCAKWAAQIRRILRPNGSFFLNVGSAPSNPMLPHQIAIELTSDSGGFFLQNTIHWIKSIAINTAEARKSPANPHLDPLPGQTIVTSTSFTLRNRDELKSIGLLLAFRTRTKAILRAGRTLVGAICAVAATRGSFPTRQFRIALRSGRIPRRFRFNSPSGASNCTVSHESKRCSICFSGSEIPLSLRSAAA